MKTHLDQIFSMAQELPGQSDNKIGGISAFLFLHFACHDQHFGSWMLNFELDRSQNTSLRMVAASEVT